MTVYDLTPLQFTSRCGGVRTGALPTKGARTNGGSMAPQAPPRPIAHTNRPRDQSSKTTPLKAKGVEPRSLFDPRNRPSTLTNSRTTKSLYISDRTRFNGDRDRKWSEMAIRHADYATLTLSPVAKLNVVRADG